jgi:hypothetical protein
MMTVRSILPASGHDVSRDLTRAHDRLDRLAVMDPEQKDMALQFLSGYTPEIFDAVLDFTEPFGGSGLTGMEDEPFCTRCGSRVGVFAELGDGWRHYRGEGITSKATPFDTDHTPIIGWRAPAETEDEETS